MPASQLSPEQRVEKKLGEAKRLQQKAQIAWAHKMMQKHPGCVQIVVSQIQTSTGEVYGTGDVQPTRPAGSSQTPTAGGGAMLALADGTGGPENGDGGSGEGGAAAALVEEHVMTARWANEQDSIPRHKRLPSCITAFRLCPVGFLKAMLHEVDPVIFSRFSLCALIPPKKREAPREDVMHVVTFLTGFDDSTFITTDMRVWGNLIDITLGAVRARGSRQRSIGMPPVWPRHGAYAIEVTDREIMLSHKFDKTKAAVPKAILGKVNVKKIYVEFNFCDRQASLSDGDNVHPTPCYKLLAEFKAPPGTGNCGKPPMPPGSGPSPPTASKGTSGKSVATGSTKTGTPVIIASMKRASGKASKTVPPVKDEGGPTQKRLRKTVESNDTIPKAVSLEAK